MKRPRINFRRFYAILRKEIIQVKRDRISLAIPIVMPIVLMLLFGYAVNTEVEHIKTAVFDMSATQESREYIASFKASNFFDIVYYADSGGELTGLIESGDIKAALTIPPDFARQIKAGRVPQCELQIDGSDPTTARTAMSSGLLINEMVSLKLREDFAGNAGAALSAMPSVTLAARVLYNPNLESRRFTIPGLVALIMQNITVMLTAFSLVREKERGTIEQLIVTPIRSSELIIGKLIPYIVIGYAGFLFSLGLCIFWFGIWPAGSLWLLLALGALFVICSLMIGMLISTVSKNQLQAMLAMIVIMLPSILLSGFIFPREAMPPVIAQLGLLFPITYFLDIIRGIVLKGVGADMMVDEILLLTGICALLFSVTIVRFRKSFD